MMEKMKKILATARGIADKATSLLKSMTSTVEGKIAAAIIAVGIFVAVWALVAFRVMILKAVGTAVALIFVAWAALERPTQPLPPVPTVEEVYTALEMFFNYHFEELRGTLPLFKSVYADPTPTTETGAIRHCPRLIFWQEVHNGIVVACVGMLCVGGTMPGPMDLIRGRQVLQGLITDSFWRGRFPLSGSPIYSDGTPTLCLYEVTADGVYLKLRFVWVDNDETAAFVRRYDLPPTGGDDTDEDF